MAKVKEDQEVAQFNVSELLEKLEIDGIDDHKHDLHVVKGTHPKDVILCTIEKQEVKEDKTRKISVLETYEQKAEYPLGFFKGLTFNSEGYCEEFKITLVGVKPRV